MQFAIEVTVLECSFVKHSHGPLGVNVVYFGNFVVAKIYDLILVISLLAWSKLHILLCS
jgi:hypothetical protein